MTVKVLYIAGNGRSGSTLLDRVLGRVPGTMSLGEVRFVWEFGFVRNNLCECGAAFRDCEFWSAVTREAFGEVDEARAVRLAKESRKLLWTPAIARLKGWFPTRAHRRMLEEHTELTGRLYRAIARHSGAAVLVDSSKLASYALLLDRLPDVETHVIHLVRDSRALAFSWKRKKVMPEVTGKKLHMPIRPAFLTALRWNLHNLLGQSLARTSSSYLRVRYEDFVREPEQTVRSILGSVGDDRDRPLDFFHGNEVEFAPGHTVAGNPSRFTHGRVRIRVDDEWRDRMPAMDRSLVTFLTMPQLRAYGYPLRPGAQRRTTESDLLRAGPTEEEARG